MICFPNQNFENQKHKLVMTIFLCNWPERWADSNHMTHTEWLKISLWKMAESKLTITAEEIYIFLTNKKLYFGQIIKAILMHLQDTKFIFAQVKCCVIFSLIARRWFFSNGYQQSFASDNSSNLFWLDQDLRSTSENKV